MYERKKISNPNRNPNQKSTLWNLNGAETHGAEMLWCGK